MILTTIILAALLAPQPAGFKALGLKVSQGRSRSCTWEVVR